MLVRAETVPCHDALAIGQSMNEFMFTATMIVWWAIILFALWRYTRK